MKSFVKLFAAVTVLLAVLFAGANIYLNINDKGDAGRPYRVEAERIAAKIENGEAYDTDDYETIVNVEKLTGGFKSGEYDYLIKEINGVPYRFDYDYTPEGGDAAAVFNICFAALTAAVVGVMIFICVKIIRPFETIVNYPAELAKGTLTAPLKESRDKYFGRFLWGLDLLREKLESQKSAELALQKQNKTMMLSLSHDIKTPLGVIELYAKALEKGLYGDEDKKRRAAVGIHEKCEEIRGYIDEISKAARGDFLNLETENGEFYLAELVDNIRSFYNDKLSLLKIDFEVGEFSNRLLSGDRDRAEEALQNIIENAVKYGDGRRITVSFSEEEECQLIHVTNCGCKLSDSELPHIFDSFWRGSNVGSNGGSGLGLYICRTLMRKMNGEVYAEIDGDEITVTMVFQIA